MHRGSAKRPSLVIGTHEPSPGGVEHLHEGHVDADAGLRRHGVALQRRASSVGRDRHFMAAASLHDGHHFVCRSEIAGSQNEEVEGGKSSPELCRVGFFFLFFFPQLGARFGQFRHVPSSYHCSSLPP